MTCGFRGGWGPYKDRPQEPRFEVSWFSFRPKGVEGGFTPCRRPKLKDMLARWLRCIALVLGVLVLVVVVAGLAYVGRVAWAARTAVAAVDGTRSGIPVEGPVTIARDGRGVPHVRAGSLHDLMVAEGYAMGSDRLYQMDVTRRYVDGRLAELLGSPVVRVDRRMRRFAIRELGGADLRALQPRGAGEHAGVRRRDQRGRDPRARAAGVRRPLQRLRTLAAGGCARGRLRDGARSRRPARRRGRPRPGSPRARPGRDRRALPAHRSGSTTSPPTDARRARSRSCRR